MQKSTIMIGFLLVCFTFSEAFTQQQRDRTAPIERDERKDTDEEEQEEKEREEFDTIEFTQPNGSNLYIKGLRIGGIYYTETKDGYTIVQNDEGIYEYAEISRNGDLVPSGYEASDPEDRSAEEVSFLNNVSKHLRYEPPKLDELENKSPYEFHEREH